MNLTSDPLHCGDCTTTCRQGDHAAALCIASTCSLECAGGYGDCDNNPANGCETPTTVAVDHCGACGHACPTGPHATTACVSGMCAVTCETGYGDCDHDPATGCESDFATPASCGACGVTCAMGQVCHMGVCATSRHGAFVYAPNAAVVRVYSPTANRVRIALDTGDAPAMAISTLSFTAAGALSAPIDRGGVVQAEGDFPFVLWVGDELSGDKITAASALSGSGLGAELYTWAGSNVVVFTGDLAPRSVRVERVGAPGVSPVVVGTWEPGPDQQRSFGVNSISAIYRVVVDGGSVTAFGQLLNETYNHFAYVFADTGSFHGTSFRYAEPAGASGVRRLMVQSNTDDVDVTFTVGMTVTRRHIDTAVGVTAIEFPADTLVRAQTSAAVIAWVEADPNNGCDGTLLDADLVPSVNGVRYDTQWDFRTTQAITGCFVNRRPDVDVLAFTDDTRVTLYTDGGTSPAAHFTLDRGQRARLLTDTSPNRRVRVVTSLPAWVEQSHDAGQFALRAVSVNTFQ